MEFCPIRVNTKTSITKMYTIPNLQTEVKNFQSYYYATKIWFTINRGCKFTLFPNNFNIEKVNFILSFCLHRKGHVDMTRN